MTHLTRPVLGADLAGSPEMALRHPAEVAASGHSSSNDEGAGCGFDNISPDAYAERWVNIDARPKTIVRWYEDKLTTLGWHTTWRSKNGLKVVRDPDERVRIDIMTTNSIRICMAVDGVFPDGTTGPRIG